jgi:hypothetical protein
MKIFSRKCLSTLVPMVLILLSASCIPSRAPEPPGRSHVFADESEADAPADAEVERVATTLATLFKPEFEPAFNRLQNAKVECESSPKLQQLIADAWRVGDVAICKAAAACPAAKTFSAEHRYYLTSCVESLPQDWYAEDKISHPDWALSLQIYRAYRTKKMQDLKLNGVDLRFTSLIAAGQKMSLEDENKAHSYILKLFSTRPIVADRLIEIELHRIAMENRYKDSLKLLSEYFKSQSKTTFQNVIGMFGAYAAIFAMPRVGVKAARQLAESYVPYVKTHAFIPNERNAYTYTELYDSRCRESLLQGSNWNAFRSIMSARRAGCVKDDETLSKLQTLLAIAGRKADILTAIGGLHHVKGEVTSATTLYWEAHRLCPFFNQSANALKFLVEGANIKKDFASPIVWQAHETEALQIYVSNYSMHGADAMSGFQYSMALWKKFIPALNELNEWMYVKYPFELMSEIPKLEFVRDARRDDIPFDNRLWDDVRGTYSSIGQVVVADYFELMKGASTQYDVTLHELSHQVDAAALSLRGTKCVRRLYQASVDRKSAVSAYSLVSPQEYFAEAATAYAAGNHSRPMNQESLRKVDPDILRFIENLSQTAKFDFPCISNGAVISNKELAAVEVLPFAEFRMTKEASFRRGNSKRVLKKGEIVRAIALYIWTDDWYWMEYPNSNGEKGFVRKEEVEKL